MHSNPNDLASAKYENWTGSIAADESDLQNWEQLLGIDSEEWRLVHLVLVLWERNQWIEPYVIKRDSNLGSLVELVHSGEAIVLTRLPIIEIDDPSSSDTNPPIFQYPPVSSVVDFLKHAFKRLEIKFYSSILPDDAKFEVAFLLTQSDLD